MNIFKILSSADGNINEPNISAFLAYLLNPSEDHSLGCDFLLEVLANEDEFNLIDDDRNAFRAKIENGNYKVEIITERTVFPGIGIKDHRDIDILIQISGKDSDQVKYAICIENKILAQSVSDKNQLNEEMEGLAKFYKEISPNVKLGLIYIVPYKTDKITIFFNNVKKFPHKKILLWKSDDNNVSSIRKFLEKILIDESTGIIDPIYESMRHLIKSFIAFINYDFKCTSEVKNIQAEKNDYGKPIREYLKDIWEKMEYEKPSPVKEIRKKLRELVKNASGKTLNKNTELCQIYRATVNNPVRVNYYVKTPEDGNLFYKSDNNKLNKFGLDKAQDDIEIYYKEKGEVKRITVGELKETTSNDA